MGTATDWLSSDLRSCTCTLQDEITSFGSFHLQKLSLRCISWPIGELVSQMVSLFSVLLLERKPEPEQDTGSHTW